MSPVKFKIGEVGWGQIQDMFSRHLQLEVLGHVPTGNYNQNVGYFSFVNDSVLHSIIETVARTKTLNNVMVISI